MATPFECEVRFKIENIEKFNKRLLALNAKLEQDYEFTDYYYKPLKEKWNPVEKILRIRKWHYPKKPTKIYLVKNEVILKKGMKFKRSLYPEGKLPLYEGNLKTCKEILIDLGFEPWLTIEKKDAKLWDLPNHGFMVAVEFIKDINWYGEFEFDGHDINQAAYNIKKATTLLNIKDFSFKPVSVLVAEARNLIK